MEVSVELLRRIKSQLSGKSRCLYAFAIMGILFVALSTKLAVYAEEHHKAVSLQPEYNLPKPPLPEIPQNPSQKESSLAKPPQKEIKAALPLSQTETPAAEVNFNSTSSNSSAEGALAEPSFPKDKEQIERETNNNALIPVASETLGSTEPVAAESLPLPQNLDELYRNNKKWERFASTDYLIQIFGILALLLGGFYLVTLFYRLSQQNSQPIVPFGKKETVDDREQKSILRTLFPGAGRSGGDIRPVVLSRVRLAPAKEIYVVQVGDRQLVIGTTAQQITLLTEIIHEEKQQPGKVQSENHSRSAFSSGKDKVYRKYLSPPSTSPYLEKVHTSIPEKEEVFILKDYEDEYEPYDRS